MNILKHAFQIIFFYIHLTYNKPYLNASLCYQVVDFTNTNADKS